MTNDSLRARRHRSDALRSVRALVAALGQSARSIEGGTGFTNAQLFLLRQLREAGSLSVNELAARARTRPNTVSGVLARLVAAGFVRRSRASDDARRVDLSLAPRARRLLARAPTPPTEALIDALETLDEREARTVANGLHLLLSSMGITAVDPPMLFDVDRVARRAREVERADPGAA